jgi:ribonuclease VapC
MIVDSSALLSIVLGEDDADALVDKLQDASAAGIGAPTLAAAAIVVASRAGAVGRAALDDFVRESALVVVPFRAEHAAIARDASLRFGKGRHPASLNFGDCLTYAVARAANQPLLCTGGDFSLTDLALA